jgi:hypothetical protein
MKRPMIISKKSGRELLYIKVDKDTMLENKELFVGQEVEKELRQLGLKPTSAQLSWLFEMARSFHKTTVEFLQKYFETGLKSPVMDNMSALSPHRQSHLMTARKLKSLAYQYSKIVDNIEPIDGMDQLKTEIDRYVVDDDVKNIKKDGDYEGFWDSVGALTDGEARCRGVLRFGHSNKFGFPVDSIRY